MAENLYQKSSYSDSCYCIDRSATSYVLAFMGQVQIAESLSSTIATTIVGVMVGYFLKALFETFFEKREERLNKESESAENTNYEEV